MKKYGIVGSSLGHSMSPFIHKALFALSGREVSYDVYEVDSISSFNLNNPDMTGYNITIPHKVDAYHNASSIHESALPYGAVNCVDCNGVGYNTDVAGFRMSVLEIIENFDIKVLLLGFGGVGKMVAKQFNPSKLTIAIRNTSLDRLTEVYELVGNGVRVVGLDSIPLEEYDLVVNSTPIGMYPNAGVSPVSDSVISRCSAVYDMVYNPLETKFIIQGNNHNAKVKGGIDMLVYQAVVAHKYWYGAEFDMVDVEKIVIDVKCVLGQKEWL